MRPREEALGAGQAENGWWRGQVLTAQFSPMQLGTQLGGGSRQPLGRGHVHSLQMRKWSLERRGLSTGRGLSQAAREGGPGWGLCLRSL